MTVEIRDDFGDAKTLSGPRDNVKNRESPGPLRPAVTPAGSNGLLGRPRSMY